MTSKGIRIGSDLDSFLNEHPEIKIKRVNGKIITIQIPEDALIVSLHIKDSEILNLIYLYEDKLYHYPT